MLQIPDWLDFLADIRAHDTALVTPMITITHGQMREASIAAALELKEKGVKAGQRVAVQAVSPALQIVLLVALHRLGAITCLLPQDAVRRKAGLESVAFDWLLTDNDEKLSAAKVLPVDINWLVGLKPAGVTLSGGFKHPHDICLISMSSGTTSPPKPMAFSVGLLEKRIYWRSIGEQGFRHGEKAMLMAGLGQMNGIQSVMGVLWCGGIAYIGFTPENAMKVVAHDRIERLFCSAFHMVEAVAVVEKQAFDVSSLRQIHCGSDALSAHLVNRVTQKMCSNLITDFGTNEAGARIAITRANPANYRCEEVGHLCPWAEAEAVDEKDRVLAPGQEGHLRFRSPLMISGYLGDAEATASRFRNGWFYSDDIGWVTADRRLVITGRARDFIQTASGRFNPVTIDHGFADHPRIAEAAAFGMPATGGDEIWLALVERAPVSDAELREFCVAKFGPRAPRHFLRVKRLPRNEPGKIMRNMLRDLAGAQAAQA